MEVLKAGRALDAALKAYAEALAVERRKVVDEERLPEALCEARAAAQALMATAVKA